MLRTREAIMLAFEELLEEKPATKITVSDIAQRCGITRNTFYYHFQDIPALIRETMEHNVDQIIATQYIPGSPMECSRPIIEQILKKKKPLLNMYRHFPRENFQRMLTAASQYLVDAYFTRFMEEHPEASPEHLQTMSSFFRWTIVGMLLDWMEEGLPESFLGTVEEIYRLLEGTTQELLERRRPR